MNGKTQPCNEALQKLAESIAIGDGLPTLVFRGQWTHFNLFDPDWMFDGTFVERAHEMQMAESSSCICVVRLGLADDDRNSRFLIDHKVTPGQYQARLGADIATGWIYDVGSYGCMSDKGEWCIYCERASEMAIIGFRAGVSHEKYLPILNRLHAGSVALVLAGRADYELSSHVITEEWKEQIAQNYG